MGKILRHLLEALRRTAVLCSNFGNGAKDVAADQRILEQNRWLIKE